MRYIRKIKSIIAFQLVLMLLLSVASGYAVAAETLQVNTSNPSSELSDAEKAYEILKAVGAIDGQGITYTADAVVTRGEFIKLVLQISGEADIAGSYGGVFYDVSLNSAYGSYIETAYRLGYIGGTPGGLFYPDEAVTLIQATKILVKVLGYDALAEAKGGYPNGYVTAANSIKLLKGISTSLNDALTMEQAMLLLFNAADTEMMQTASLGEYTGYDVLDGETLLYLRHDVSVTEGVIEANRYTDLYATKSSVDINGIKLNGTTYATSGMAVQNMLGYAVKLYYKASASKAMSPVALYADVTRDNYVVTTSGDDISIERDRVYYDSSSTRNPYLKISSTATFILNGKMAAMTLNELVGMEKSEITFISNDNDNVIDVISICCYETYQLGGVSTVSKLLTAKDGTKIEVDSENDAYTFELIKNGKSAELEDLNVNDVVLLSEGKGAGLTHKRILVSGKAISGTFEEIGDDYAVFSKVRYALSASLKNKLAVGKEYTIYLDAIGQISFAEQSNGMVYAYLYALAKERIDDYLCRVFTENNRWGNLKLADRLELNGERVTDEYAYNYFKSMGDYNYRQLIRYTVNSDAEINKIETAADIKLGTAAHDAAVDSDTFRCSFSGSATYRQLALSFDGNFFADASTKVFDIPTGDDVDEDDFAVKTYSAFKNDTGYTVTAFDIDETLTAGAITKKATGVDTGLVDGGRVLLIENAKGSVTNYEGDAVPSISGWWNGMKMTFPVKIGEDGLSSAQLNSLKAGDLVFFSYDNNGDIVYVNKCSPDEKYFKLTSGLYVVSTLVGGRVSNADLGSGKMTLQYKEDGATCGVKYGSSIPVYLWNSKYKTFTKTTAQEIGKGDFVCLNLRYLNAQEIFIIR